LGCYGHEQEGKQYSTHYVADGKGYRLVRPDKTITVFPKDGSEARQASFAKSFTDETIRNGNVNYVFPEGCESPQIEVEVPRIQKKDEFIPLPPVISTTTTTEPETTMVAESESETTTVAEPEEETTLEPEIETTMVPELMKATIDEKFEEVIEDVCAKKCCDENRAEIKFPMNNANGCCHNISKIILPIDTDMLSRCSIEEIVDITNETDKVKMLKKLLKFTIKYKF
jgi:hypothetical protein